MAIDEFELFHGIVLAKLVRSERPLTLRMIETRPGEAWSIYRLNDEVDLFVKYSTTPRATVRGGEGRSWPFVFGVDQLRQMRKSNAKGGVFVALVGGSRQVKDPSRCICLLTPDEMNGLLDFSSNVQQALTVKLLPGKSLRVYFGHQERLKVPQNRLENWQVPGN